MKILIIARGYPTPNHPLFGCFEATQAHALQKLGHEVIYIGLNFYSAKNWDIIGTNHRIVDGINIYEHYFLAVPEIDAGSYYTSCFKERNYKTV